MHLTHLVNRIDPFSYSRNIVLHKWSAPAVTQFVASLRIWVNMIGNGLNFIVEYSHIASVPNFPTHKDRNNGHCAPSDSIKSWHH